MSEYSILKYTTKIAVLKPLPNKDRDDIIDTDSISQVARQLKELYNNRDKSSESIVAFFDMFPNTFNQFNDLYGYIDGDGGAPLYGRGYEHIDFICTTEKIGIDRKLDKFIDIGINGHWEADNIGYLQEKLIDLIIQNPDIALKIINNLSREEAFGLWYFLFDGPHPSDTEVKSDFDEMYNMIKDKDAVQTELLKKAYEKLLSDEEIHG